MDRVYKESLTSFSSDDERRLQGSADPKQSEVTEGASMETRAISPSNDELEGIIQPMQSTALEDHGLPLGYTKIQKRIRRPREGRNVGRRGAQVVPEVRTPIGVQRRKHRKPKRLVPETKTFDAQNVEDFQRHGWMWNVRTKKFKDD